MHTSYKGPRIKDRVMSEPIRVLLFTKTEGFRHDCITALGSALVSFPFEVRKSERSEDLLDLSHLDVIVLGHNTGSFLTSAEAEALNSFVKNGAGVVGIHAAACGMSNNSYYSEILGAVFESHPPPRWLSVEIKEPRHYITSGLALQSPSPVVALTSARSDTLDAISWYDEAYVFRPRPSHARQPDILFSTITSGSEVDGFDTVSPSGWCNTLGKGRVFYTALGHFDEAYQTEWFLEVLCRSITWVAKRD